MPDDVTIAVDPRMLRLLSAFEKAVHALACRTPFPDAIKAIQIESWALLPCYTEDWVYSYITKCAQRLIIAAQFNTYDEDDVDLLWKLTYS